MLNKRKKAREWARHCKKMQNELNENNWNRFGWYVHKGSDSDEMVFNWSIYVNKGYGLILKYDQL